MQESSSAYTLAARRPIAAGDEVTSDYGTSTGEADFAMPWSCGSALCRGTITGNDWHVMTCVPDTKITGYLYS
jgi:hypothetical protein